MAQSSAGKKIRPLQTPETAPGKRGETARYPTLPPVPGAPEKVGGKIGAMIEEALQHEPIELKPEEALEWGEWALSRRIKNVPKGLIIESGPSQTQFSLKTEFKGSVVSGGSFPGQKKPSGLYPENKVGMTIYSDEANNRLSMYIASIEGFDPEDAAAANAGTITAAYELASDNGELQRKLSEFEKMERLFDHCSTSVAAVMDEFGAKDKKVDMLGATLSPTPDNSAWRLTVANNGKNHCMIIDPVSGKYESVRPGLRKPGSDRPVEKPVSDEFAVGTGEIFVSATDNTVEALGGEKKLAETIFQRLKKGESIEVIRKSLLDEVVNGQEEGKSEDTSVGMIATVVPALESKNIL